MAIATLAALLIRQSVARVLIVALIIGALLMSIRLTSMQQSEMVRHFGTHVEYQARVRSDPIVIARKVHGNTYSEKKYSFLANTSQGPIRVITDRKSTRLNSSH